MESLTIEKKLDAILQAVKVPKMVFTAREAAAYLCISYDALMRYARMGEIRSANNGANRIFKRDWLDEWVERGGTR